MRKLFFIILTMLSPLCASWNAFSIAQENECKKMQSDQKFLALQRNLNKFNENSWCTKEKTDLITELLYLTKPKIAVEIGVFTGSSLIPIAATFHYLNLGKAFAIDAWSNDEAIKGLPIGEANRSWWKSLDMNAIRLQFESNLEIWKLKKNVETIWQSSRSAVSLIPKIDFLHLDGGLSAQTSLEDVQNFVPKVKSGGYILYSNLLYTILDECPRLEAFESLLDDCEIICGIEDGNCALLRKL